MAEEIGSKPIDVQTLENIDSFDDLPDVTELTEEQLYAIRSGDFSSDYIAPFEWDGASYEKWRSIIDGEVLFAIPDSEADHYYPATAGLGDTIVDENGGDDLSGSLSWGDAEGIGDTYPDFNGTDEIVRSGINNSVWGSTTATLAAWFKPESSGESRPYGIYVDGVTSAVVFFYDRDGSNTLSAFINDGDGGNNLNLGREEFVVGFGEWAFATITFDLSTNEATLYAGLATDSSITEVDSSTSYDDGTVPDGDVLAAGADGRSSSGSDHFEGGVDAMEYWADTVRTESELNDWFNETKEFYQ